MPSPRRHSWPLRIGLLTHSVNPRGGVVHTLELASALHAAGHRVTVFAPALAGQQLFRPVPFAVELVRVEPHAGGTAGMVAARMDALERYLNGVLQQEHFDVLHAQDPIGANALANLQEQGLIDGFVRTVHHLDTFTDPHLTHWQTRGMQAASAVLCVSRHWCHVLQNDYGIAAHQVHNGVDLQRYHRTATGADQALRERFGLRGGSSAPVILAVGGIEERKNSLRILEAFAQLRHNPLQSHSQAQLVIAGGTSLLDHDAYVREFHARLAAMPLSQGAGGDVVITGALPDADMPALFRSADVLAMPSLREGFGLVVLEALASGTPVAVSRIAPFTEYLSDADCSWADPQDSASIAAALQAALQPARAQALQTTPAVCHQFSWTSSALRHVDLYHAQVALRRNGLMPHSRFSGDHHARYAL